MATLAGESVAASTPTTVPTLTAVTATAASRMDMDMTTLSCDAWMRLAPFVQVETAVPDNVI